MTKSICYKLLFIALAVYGFSEQALADVSDAARAAKAQPYFQLNGAVVASTALPGFYALAGSDATNPLKGMGFGFNESAALTNGGGRGKHNHLVPHQPKLTAEEEHAWRGTVMRGIDTSKLIKLVFGSGERKLFMVTALDCGHCFRLETRLAKLAPKLNATVYLVPLTLSPDQSSLPTYNAIACSANPAREWTKAMVQRKFPPGTVVTCGAATLEDTLIVALALGETATPAIVQEDGSTAHAYDTSDDAVLIRTFSEAGKADLTGDVFTEQSPFTVADAFKETVVARARPTRQPQQSQATNQPADIASRVLGGFLGGLMR